MDNFRKALKTAVTGAGVERNGKPMHLTPHMLRKAYATWQAERGIEETTLQTLLGPARGSKVTRKV
ncbi:MAG: tyrosine-type recombinase/integrase [Phycisphaerales bacterium]